MKSVLISIQPRWCELIATGEKTLEVRKTRPKLETPFKCYIYCTKAGELLSYSSYCGFDMDDFRKDFRANGNIIGEFTCDRIDVNTPHCLVVKEDREKATAGSCLTAREIRDYLRGSQISYNLSTLPDFFCWHISNLKIYDEPKKIGEFCFPVEKYCKPGLCGGCPKEEIPDEYGDIMFDCEWKRPLSRPPQSWCYVEEVQRWAN